MSSRINTPDNISSPHRARPWWWYRSSNRRGRRSTRSSSFRTAPIHSNRCEMSSRPWKANSIVNSTGYWTIYSYLPTYRACPCYCTHHSSKHRHHGSFSGGSYSHGSYSHGPCSHGLRLRDSCSHVPCEPYVDYETRDPLYHSSWCDLRDYETSAKRKEILNGICFNQIHRIRSVSTRKLYEGPRIVRELERVLPDSKIWSNRFLCEIFIITIPLWQKVIHEMWKCKSFL